MRRDLFVGALCLCLGSLLGFAAAALVDRRLHAVEESAITSTEGSKVADDSLELIAKAENRDGSAAYELSVRYARDVGDAVAARAWMKVSAELGFVPGQVAHAGYLTSASLAQREDARGAFEWTDKAARAGYLEAMEKLAEMSESGYGAEKNDVRALAWILAATEVKRLKKSCPSTSSGMSFLELSDRQRSAEARLSGADLSMATALSKEFLSEIQKHPLQCE
jgi:hypothetical protein